MYTVLVVEDDINMCRLLEYNLRKAGYEVFVKQNPIEGLKVALEKRPDVIISDFEMPIQNGQQFCAAVRDHAEIAETPFIVITGKGSNELKMKGLSRMFDDYLEKPVDMSYLIAKVNAITRRMAREVTYSKGHDRWNY
ncbi:MAG: response regulator transcription factor [Candidatus Zhuqueibacterota bacterium]